MQFERLRKSHKKEIVIGVLAICVIEGSLTFATTRAKYKLTQSIELVKGTINYKPYDFKIMAMYKSDDGTNYTEINEIPTSGYVINEEKTYCTTDNKTQVKGKLYTNSAGEHVIKNIKKSDKCYLYFDKVSETVTTLLGDIEVKLATPDFSQAATTDEGIYKIADGMYGGTSYYWRGATTTNYVRFAGFCWRIVRINGDGTLRLIYDGSTCHANGERTKDSIAVTNEAYNPSYDRSEYAGWTYTIGSQRTLGGTSSNAKSQTDTWFNNNITGTKANKVADGKFCNDRNTVSGSIWEKQPSDSFDYAAMERIEIKKPTPTLSCPSGDTYTLKAGAITADEVVMAGAKYAIENSNFYLCNGQVYWTMTPHHWFGTTDNSYYTHVFTVQENGSFTGSWTFASFYHIRPVINLKSDTKFQSGGNGTLSNPYVVS